MRPVEEYLVFYEGQDPETVRAVVEQHIQALVSFRTSGCQDAALDEVLQAQREFIQVIPYAGDSLPEELTPSDRKHIAKVFRGAMACRAAGPVRLMDLGPPSTFATAFGQKS